MENDVPTFSLFSVEHQLAIAVTLSLSVLLPVLVRRLANPRTRNLIRRIFALGLFAYSATALTIRVGIYDLPVLLHLPLHLCGISVILGGVMLWFSSYRLYEVVYFWGIGGTIAALLTPDVIQGFPHPLFMLFFIGHGLPIMAVMFALIVMDFRPRAASLLVVLPATAGYAVLIFAFNLAVGTNYLYLLAKPPVPSPLDYFGPWPWYLAGLVVLAIAVCVVLYLPFGVYDLVTANRRQRT